MKNLFLLFASALSVFFFSCEDTNETARIDIINIVRDGATIPAYIYGNTDSKTFIILLHGGPGGSGMGYRGGIYSAGMEQDYAVVYTDQRGQGMSQGSHSSDILTPEFLSGDVYALALAIQSKYGEDCSLFLMGHSWGGMLGTQVMVNQTYSDIFKGWIEIDGAHDMPLVFRSGVRKIDSIANEQINNGVSIEYWITIQNQIANYDTITISDTDYSALNSLCYEAESQLLSDGVLNENDANFALDALGHSIFVNNSITTFISSIVSNSTIISNGLLEYSLSDQLTKIDKPCLFLWGKYDMVVPLELANKAFNSVSTTDKSLVVFQRSGHSPMISEPLLFLDVVREFIELHK